MERITLKNTLKMLAVVFYISVTIGCAPKSIEENKESLNVDSKNEVVPDSVIQFLITSAAMDFRDHQPPTPVDLRNLNMGYIKSSNQERIYILCGEFLSKENKEWVSFATIKTSGYEQYIGETQYCQDATLVLTDESLTVELKKQLNL
jgi:hypothetical protein